MNSFAGLLHPFGSHNQKLSLSSQVVFPTSICTHFADQNFEMASFGEHNNSNVSSFYCLTLVGRIKNAATLKEELFLNPAATDEELIIAVYEKFENKCFAKFEGDFAIALFDKRKKTLFLAKDPIGKKSLYWACSGGYFLFSTEIKALMATGILPQTPSKIGFASYLYFGFIPQDLTPILDVHKLLPGHFLKIDLHHQFRIIQYWSLAGHLLTEKPNTQAASTFFPVPLPTLSPKAALKDLVKIVWHLDEPIADVNVARIWHLAETADKSASPLFVDIKTTIEDFENQKIKEPLSFAHLAARMPKWLQKSLIFPLSSTFARNFHWRVLRSIDINQELMDHLPAIELFSQHERKHLSPFLYRTFNPEIFFERFHHLSAFKTSQEQMYYLNAKTKIPDSLLFQYDRLLSPFRITFEAPGAEKEGLLNSFKAPLGKKSHRVNPISQSCDHKQWKEIFHLLEKGRLVEEGLISPKWLRHHLGFPHVIERTFRQLFAVLVLEIWFRLYINQPMGKVNLNQSVKELLS
jgi:hypothetical protein